MKKIGIYFLLTACLTSQAVAAAGTEDQETGSGQSVKKECCSENETCEVKEISCDSHRVQKTEGCCGEESAAGDSGEKTSCDGKDGTRMENKKADACCSQQKDDDCRKNCDKQTKS